MTGRRRRAIVLGALALGIILFVAALRRTDVRSLVDAPRQVGFALLLAMLTSGVWHVLRAAAWWQAFPRSSRITFPRAFRVRLAAEAFSYLTISGLAGDPLKVVLLQGSLPTSIAAGAVALERAAYIVVTALILGVASLAAMTNVMLSPAWWRVFAVIALMASLVAAVVPLLLLRTRSSATAPTSPIRRFFWQLRLESRELARDPARFSILLALEGAAYLMMVLEVWVILRAVGASLPFVSVAAIETFTRAVSIVSGIIPANLGALEASNVAAATAVHVAGGAAALAIIRRLRGLAWCAGGLLIYPRSAIEAAARDGQPLVVLDDPASPLLLKARLGGWTAVERIARAAARAGYSDLLVWTTRARHSAWGALAGRVPGVAVIATDDIEEWRRALAYGTTDRITDARESAVTVVSSAVVPSPQLLAVAAKRQPAGEPAIVEIAAGAEFPASGVFRVARPVAMAADGLLTRLRTTHDRAEPSGHDVALGRASLSLRVGSLADAATAEQRLRASMFKPTDANLACFNRRFSLPLSVALIRAFRFSPNLMSVLLMIVGLYAGWLFSRGEYLTGLTAAVLSWVASVLDGCDGELARLQYKESAFGCWLDTIGDYVYYVAIYAGITVGAIRETGWVGFAWLGGALGVGMLLTFTFLILFRWRITNGRPEQLRSRARRHFSGVGSRVTRMLTKLETCATRATMPYGIVAFAVLDAMPALVVLAAFAAQIYWITLARHAGDLLVRANTSGDSGLHEVVPRQV